MDRFCILNKGQKYECESNNSHLCKIKQITGILNIFAPNIHITLALDIFMIV
jgi:hypothetical protein